MTYYEHRFITDSMAVVLVDCKLGSEGRECGVYVVDVESCIMFADRFDNGWEERLVLLTDDEFTRLNDEVAESDEAIETWEDRGGYDD